MTVTSKIPWKARLEWGKANRHRMSQKAYSRFVVGSCAARAVEEGAGLPGFVLLLRECIVGGRARPMRLILLAGTPALSAAASRVAEPHFPAPQDCECNVGCPGGNLMLAKPLLAP